VEIAVLGPLEVTLRGRSIAVAGNVQRSLLVLLAIEPGAVVPADRLADDLYGESRTNVANALQSQVSRLRRLLGADVVVGKPPGYVLDVDADAVDAGRFERLVEAARGAHAAGDATDASELYRKALSLWRGPALLDALDIDTARAAATRLEELRLTAFEERVAADLELGRHHEVVGELQAAVAEHPLREGLRAALMLALYRSGRQADALAAYQDARRRLGDELGLDPGPELRELEAAILRQDATLNPAPVPATAGAAPDIIAAAPARVPVALTTFVGREDAVRDVTALLAAHRLVTITGPGGAGKTRLALELAARHERRDGTWFVDLAVVTDPGDVAAAVGRALGVEGTGLAEYLAGKQPLIVLDNCEHVLDAVASLAGSLLVAAPVRMLATSREPLNIAGEMQWPLPPLALDDAVRLFADRAVAVQPAFAGADETVADICRRLDGMPLAIELAAARVKAFTVPDIAARLDDRFRLLTSGARTALPRHQTLRALVDWSYDLLFEDQRTLFEQLAVFPGGFALDAAEAMAEHARLDPTDTIDLLAQLVDKSLVHCEDRGGVTRYRVLETLRQYGHDRLAGAGRLDDARRRQAEWCLALAEQAAAHLYGPSMAEWLDRLVDVELDNVRAAVAWATETGDAELGVRLATACARAMWERGQQREGRAWLESALRLPGAAALPVAQRVLGLVWLSAVSSDHDRRLARDAAEQAVAVARDAPDALLAAARVMLAQALVDAGELEGASALLDAAAPLLSGWEAGWCDEVVCYVALRRADLDDAEEACRRSLAQYEALQNAWSESRMRHKLAFIAELRGDHPTAVEQYEASIALARPLAVHEVIAVRLGQLSRMLRLADDTGRAEEVGAEADALVWWLAGVDGTGRIARRRSDLALARGELTDALAWYEAAGDADGVAHVQDRLQLLADAVG